MSGKYSAEWWKKVSQNTETSREKQPDIEIEIVNAGGGIAPTQSAHLQLDKHVGRPVSEGQDV